MNSRCSALPEEVCAAPRRAKGKGLRLRLLAERPGAGEYDAISPAHAAGVLQPALAAISQPAGQLDRGAAPRPAVSPCPREEPHSEDVGGIGGRRRCRGLTGEG